MRKLLIIYTGGTIGMVQDSSGILIPFDFKNIKSNVPELGRLNYQLEVISFDPILDSSNINPESWIKMVEIIEKNYDQYDGFVILHGSDTMAYTASALSFLLENLSKPVVLTGSQLPIGEIRTDAKENLITALEIAASVNESNHPLLNEVCIYFDYQLFRGNRSKKVHSNKFEAFLSPNYPVLAEAGVHLSFNSEALYPASEGNFIAHKSMNNSISVLKIYPGIAKSIVHAVLTAEGLQAVILESFGTGNTCTDTWFVEELAMAANKGIVILDISQCTGGAVDIGRYETSKHLVEIGVVSGYDMTFETAVAKLMFLLGQNLPMVELKRLLSENLRGELTA